MERPRPLSRTLLRLINRGSDDAVAAAMHTVGQTHVAARSALELDSGVSAFYCVSIKWTKCRKYD